MALDFMKVSSRPFKGLLEIYPKFIVRNGGDLMIRGKDFYAVYDETTGLWSTDEDKLIALIDSELEKYAKEISGKTDMPVKICYLWDAETNMIDVWHKYCQKQRRDCYHPLDEKLMFANNEPKKEDYASRKLGYSLQKGECPCYEQLITTLYSPDELHKLEWTIGAVVSGDSKEIQKFAVLYGGPGTGKSTALNIIEQLFHEYTSYFDAKALGNSNNSFALEPFKTNPLVAIDHDTDLSKIEDNTRLNSLVSHETMIVNEKFKGLYEQRFKAFLFVGTNKPVKITDSKSGIIRRLIDISPTGNKVPRQEYNKLVRGIKYELGAIAAHCLDIYNENPNAYDNYIPLNMMGATNDFFNFMLDNYFVFKDTNSVRLTQAWDMYKQYCDDAKVPFPLSKMVFKEELKAYFDSYEEKGNKAVYNGFKVEKFEQNISSTGKVINSWINFNSETSLLDTLLASCHAQYGDEEGKPLKKWENVRKVLAELDTKRLHYVLVPASHIVLDFDIKDDGGEKSLERNIEAASKFPPTYAELSKSGKGIHLHYIYTGDVSKLAALIDDNIEIKVFNGNASLRRMLSKCNDIPVRTISSGLPLKEEKVINFKGVEDEKHLRAIVAKHLRKEIVPNTKPSMDLLYNVIEEAYKSGIPYDITDMRPAVMNFALMSTHQSDACLKIFQKIHWASDDKVHVDVPCDGEKPIAFFDCEVFPNLFVVCYKEIGQSEVSAFINPTSDDIAFLMENYRLVGFNCRRYDNHICYARYLGYSEAELYALSQRIVAEKKGTNSNCFFREAYNISYTDIYDYASTKQSLKKWEIQLGIFHKECEYPWDQPVDEKKWFEVVDYCKNDVIATEAVWNATQGDWRARLILAEWAKMLPNSTTNQLTEAIVFKGNKNASSELRWRDMGDMTDISDEIFFNPDGSIDEYTVFDKQHRPIFPGYKCEYHHSIYRDENPGEGGYVYSEPGIYIWLALLDIASMHPSSAIAEMLFGIYTKNFEMLKTLRIHIKHKDFDKAKALVPEVLYRYVEDPALADDLAQALKIAINAVYGLSSASFPNAFRSADNNDNIVAKRGALFMINLKHAVQLRGYTVAHIKTDSIKIANADMAIIQFVKDYGKLYGYTFEHEATYERMCLIDKSQYIARYATVEQCIQLYGEDYVNESKDQLKGNKKHPGEWTATGEAFAIPYVHKTLFTHEDITFDDLCEAKQVTTAMYLADGDNRRFIGRVGLFCPVTNGYKLLRINTDKDGNAKYDSVTGAKDYLWKEACDIKGEHEQDIDMSYFRSLVDEAIASINAAAANTNFDTTYFLSEDMYTITKE